MATPSFAQRWRRSWLSPTNSRVTSIRAWGLYKTFHAIWSTANVEEGEEPAQDYSGAEGIAQARLSRITPLSRQALL
jgi:hypothetical protein